MTSKICFKRAIPASLTWGMLALAIGAALAVGVFAGGATPASADGPHGNATGGGLPTVHCDSIGPNGPNCPSPGGTGGCHAPMMCVQPNPSSGQCWSGSPQLTIGCGTDLGGCIGNTCSTCRGNAMCVQPLGLDASNAGDPNNPSEHCPPGSQCLNSPLQGVLNGSNGGN